MLYQEPIMEILEFVTEDVICQSLYDDVDTSGEW